MEGCGMSCIKYLLFVFNFIFAVSGVGIIVTGAIILAETSDFKHFVDADTLTPPIILIVAGSLVFLIAFLGCCGAIKENRKMLIAFAVFLIIIFIVELAIGITAAVNKETVSDGVKSNLRKSLENYKESEIDREAWNLLQSKFECCGVEGYRDWNLGNHVPASCCKSNSTQNMNALCVPRAEITYQEGCYEKLKMRLKDGSLVLMIVGISIAFVELAGVILACFLATAIKKEEGEAEKE